VRCHLGRDAWQCLRQEADRAHAGFDGAKRKLDPLPTLTPSSLVFIEPALNRFKNVLVFPSPDAALFPGMFDGAVRASATWRKSRLPKRASAFALNSSASAT
jgi:hypothetical protein